MSCSNVRPGVIGLQTGRKNWAGRSEGCYGCILRDSERVKLNGALIFSAEF